MNEALMIDLLEKVEIAGEQSAKVSNEALAKMEELSQTTTALLERNARLVTTATQDTIARSDLDALRSRLLSEQETRERRMLDEIGSVKYQLGALSTHPERHFNIKVGWEVTKPFRFLTGFILTLTAILGAWHLLLEFNPFKVEWWIWSLEYFQKTGRFPPEMAYSSIAILLVPLFYFVFKWYRNGP